MAYLSPEITLLRNALIRSMRAENPPRTYDEIGEAIGSSRQTVYKLIIDNNLDPRHKRYAPPAPYTEDEARIVRAARRLGVEPPAPLRGSRK